MREPQVGPGSKPHACRLCIRSSGVTSREMRSLACAIAITLAACSGAQQHGGTAGPGDDDTGPFVASRTFKPKSFSVHVTGEGRAVIFIPRPGCPGAVRD